MLHYRLNCPSESAVTHNIRDSIVPMSLSSQMTSETQLSQQVCNYILHYRLNCPSESVILHDIRDSIIPASLQLHTTSGTQMSQWVCHHRWHQKLNCPSQSVITCYIIDSTVPMSLWSHMTSETQSFQRVLLRFDGLSRDSATGADNSPWTGIASIVAEVVQFAESLGACVAAETKFILNCAYKSPVAVHTHCRHHHSKIISTGLQQCY